MRKPIGPTLHGALDYGFVAAMVSVPRLLGLPRRARLVAAAFGMAQGGLNAVTDQPLAVRHLVPFPRHGTVDRAGLPVVLGLPLLTGLLRDRRTRAFFLGSGAALAALYTLTDWDAQPGTERPGTDRTGTGGGNGTADRAVTGNGADRGDDGENTTSGSANRGSANGDRANEDRANGDRANGDTQPAPRQPGPQSLGSAGPDAGGVTDARSATAPATPAEGPADAAGPTIRPAAGSDGPRRPATVDTAPSIRSTPSTTAHSTDTGAEDAGT